MKDTAEKSLDELLELLLDELERLEARKAELLKKLEKVKP